MVLTYDGSVNALYAAQSSSGVGVPVSREMGIRIYKLPNVGIGVGGHVWRLTPFPGQDLAQQRA